MNRWNIFATASIVALFMVAAIPSAPAVAAPITPSQDAYTAYYDYLQQKVGSVGILEFSEIDGIDLMATPEQEGICYARLIDLDGDGTSELFTIESKKVTNSTGGYSNYEWDSYDLFYALYTYKGGAMTSLLSGDFSIGHYFAFSKDGAGTNYVVIKDGSLDGTYYSYKNGNMYSKQLSTFSSYDWSVSGSVNGQHVWAHSDTAHVSSYMLDGEWTDYSGFISQKMALESGGYEEYGIYSYSYPETAPAGTVRGVLNELAVNIPQNYVETYWNPSAWASSVVAKAIESQTVPNNLQNKYGQPITRAEFCALATQYYETTTGKAITVTAQFNDTSDINVQKMAGLSVVNGIGNGEFAPNRTLSRQEAATILARLAKVMGTDLPTGTASFNDGASIANWATTQVGQMVASGVMNGVGNNTFAPLAPYTREQSIVTVARLTEALDTVEAINIDSSIDFYRVGESNALTAVITPATAYDARLKWSTSNNKVATVDNSGHVVAVGTGKATITVEAVSGVKSICEIVVEHDADFVDLQFETKVPTTLNCLSFATPKDGSSYSYEFPENISVDYFPKDAFVLGTINVSEVSSNYNEGTIEISMKGKVLKINKGEGWGSSKAEEQFTPYVKWILRDQAGKIIKSDISLCESTYRPMGSVYYIDPGDGYENQDFTVHISLKDVNSKQKFTLEFVNDEPEYTPDNQESWPELKFKGLPVSGDDTYTDYVSTDVLKPAVGHEVLYASWCINEAEVVSMEYDYSRDNYEVVILIGGYVTPATKTNPYSFSAELNWEVADAETGEIVDSNQWLYGDISAYESEGYAISEEIHFNLNRGGTYTFTFTGISFD